MKLYIWTDRFSYLAVAHTNNVEAARKLMLETSDLGESGDGSCPERDRARKTILEETPAIYFGEVAEFSLSDSAQLREQEEHSETLQQQMAAKDRRIAELEAKVAQLEARSDDFDAEMTIVARAVDAAFEDGRLDPRNKANAQLADIAESKKWMTEQVDDMRERIAELEAQIAAHPAALAAAKREALEAAAVWFESAPEGWIHFIFVPEKLRRMAREVK